MAIFKCKMCGGSLEIANGTTVIECEYCGTKQTLSKNSDDVTSNLFNRANSLRLKCDFDKAHEIYEKIVSSVPDDSEAYWGLVLCKYGIEYVEDPATKRKIPTCHRTQLESVLTDVDYNFAIQNADVLQKAVYEAEAKEIDRLQKEILSIAQKEDPFDVFICYKETDENGKRTHDSVIANDIYHQLTQEGFKVFYAAITLEGKLGQAYEPYIFSALNSAKVMLVIGTKPEYFNAVWVKNEWSRYIKLMNKDRSRLLIPCYKDMDAYDLPEEFSHLQAQDMTKIGFINDLIRGIKKVLVKEKTVEKTVEKEYVTQTVVQTATANNNEYILDDGIYIGEMFGGKPHGVGIATYKNGNIYEGDWYAGKRHGQGKLTQQGGGTKEGEYRDGALWNGYLNEWKYDDGDTYTGEVKAGKLNGQGKLTQPGGGTQEGEFRDGALWNGYCKGYKVDNGDVYTVEIKEGTFNGQGKLTQLGGGTKEGEFRDGALWNGYWKGYKLDNGYISTVEIKEGKLNGQGKRTQPGGGTQEGEFRDGALWNGYEKEWKYNGGIIYTGEIKEGKLNGQGKLTQPGGGTREGEFCDGALWNGYLTAWEYDDGEVYTGPMKNGKISNSGGGGCYIATCVYGSYDCPEVWTLRRYRDDTLASTWYGRAFIHVYYAISPTLVKWFGKTSWFKKIWQGKLDRMVAKLQRKGVEDTPYEDKEW